MNSHQPIDLLTALPALKRLLKSRTFQPALMLGTLFIFVLVILTGLFGTAVGSRNFSIIFVWIVWWAFLMLMLVPFLGRAWCAMCPIPALGEWLQRGSIINRKPGDLHTLDWRWSRWLKNMWLQNFGFLGIALFSAVILTRPTITAWVLLSFMLVSVVLSALYKNRVFCRYVCPVGGFIGLYSMLAPVEVRVRDSNVCLEHRTKDCITGNQYGYGCPWGVYPGNLTRNVYCGTCMECLKTCPQSNIVLNLRVPGSDLLVGKERRLDEAYKAFIMLGCALSYSVVLLGRWGWLKNWANLHTLPHWGLYALGFLCFNLLILPGLFWLTVALTRKLVHHPLPVRRLFVDYAYALVPMGLAGWMAFSLGFVFVNGSYVFAVLSDPFGWGWNLFGTADTPWTPMLSNSVPYLQLGILMGGLLFAVHTTYKIALQNLNNHQRAFQAMQPVTGFLVVVTLGFLWLYMG